MAYAQQETLLPSSFSTLSLSLPSVAPSLSLATSPPLIPAAEFHSIWISLASEPGSGLIVTVVMNSRFLFFLTLSSSDTAQIERNRNRKEARAESDASRLVYTHADCVCEGREGRERERWVIRMKKEERWRWRKIGGPRRRVMMTSSWRSRSSTVCSSAKYGRCSGRWE